MSFRPSTRAKPVKTPGSDAPAVLGQQQQAQVEHLVARVVRLGVAGDEAGRGQPAAHLAQLARCDRAVLHQLVAQPRDARGREAGDARDGQRLAGGADLGG